MAARRSCWDLPYRSHHQQLVQLRRSPGDLPEQRRSKGVRTYDQPQPPHLRGMPSHLEMPQQQTYGQTPYYTGMGRYEQLFDQLDAAMSRLESRWEAIERRVTKLQASKAAYRRYPSNYDTDPYQQHHHVDFDCRQPRRRLTCWDPPSRTSARRVGEIRAPPLPEPPPQSALDLLYGQPPCGTSDTYASEHTTCSSFWPRGFPPDNSATPHHPLTTISNHSHTPSQPQLMLDQKPPLQHLLDQQPKPSHRRAAVPPAPAAAPPPPLHVDQHRSPSCCHPTTHLRQAETCLELPLLCSSPCSIHRASTRLRSLFLVKRKTWELRVIQKC